MNNVPVYQPDVRVTLYKTIGRQTLDGTNPVSQRFINTNQTLDLTAWLGESGGFRTSKSVREAAGSFSITLVDQPYASGGALESLYGLIEPQDFVEIRLRHNAPSASANPTLPPIHMRGFVSQVRRTEVMGQDGRPQRAVTLSGYDYGKLWQMLQIQYLPGYVIGQDILSGFQLFERWGIGFTTSLTVNSFITQVIEAIVNPFLQSLMPANSPNPTTINVAAAVQGTSGISAIQSAQGTIYNILREYCDVGIWNELYLEDREDGVYCVLRPNPFLDINRKKIQSDAPSLSPIVLLDSDVISLDVSRSDGNIANYYWVRAPQFDMNSDNLMRLQWGTDPSTSDTVLQTTYLNSAQQYYGVRLMQVDTQTGSPDVTTFNSGQSAAQNTNRDASMSTWITSRRAIMLNQNKDNVLFESGGIRARANESIKPGNYVQLTRGAFTPLYYVTQVDTDYVPFQGVFATYAVERGTGFIDRVKAGAVASPYLAELTGAANGA